MVALKHELPQVSQNAVRKKVLQSLAPTMSFGAALQLECPHQLEGSLQGSWATSFGIKGDFSCGLHPRHSRERVCG